jgi:hypothetical protein
MMMTFNMMPSGHFANIGQIGQFGQVPAFQYNAGNESIPLKKRYKATWLLFE